MANAIFADKEDLMPVFVIFGALLATLALVLYSIAILKAVITARLKRSTLVVQLIAVVFDFFATVCMMLQAGNIIPKDAHGWIGYSALCLMVVDLVAALKNRNRERIPVCLRVFAAIALCWWVFSYSLGAVKM